MVEAEVMAVNKGGAMLQVEGLRAFMPGSHYLPGQTPTEALVGQMLKVRHFAHHGTRVRPPSHLQLHFPCRLSFWTWTRRATGLWRRTRKLSSTRRWSTSASALSSRVRCSTAAGGRAWGQGGPLRVPSRIYSPKHHGCCCEGPWGAR